LVALTRSAYGSGNASATVGNNTILHVNAPDKGKVTFSETTRDPVADQPSTFSGTVAGYRARNIIDLAGIALDAQTNVRPFTE